MTTPADNLKKRRAPEVVKPLAPNPAKPVAVHNDIGSPPPPVAEQYRKEDPGRVPVVTSKAEPPPIPPAAVPTQPPPVADAHPANGALHQPPPRARVSYVPAIICGLVLIVVAGIIFLVDWSSSQTTQSPMASPPSPLASPNASLLSMQERAAVPLRLPANPDTQAIPATPIPIKPMGKVRFVAYTVVADGKQVRLVGSGVVFLKNTGSDFTLSTNVVLSSVWQNIPTGEYDLSMSATGYKPSDIYRITVSADETMETKVVLQPLPSKVHFYAPNNDVRFSVYEGDRLLGDASQDYEFPPFISTIVTFKAPGRRDLRLNVQLSKPGIPYNCPVVMERAY